MLLASCDLEEKEKQMVMSAIQEVNYVNMKATISKIFVNCPVHTTSASSSAGIQIKSEPLFIEGDENSSEGDALYVGLGMGRAGRGLRGRRGYVRGTRGRQRQRADFQQQVGLVGKRKKNPVGPDGKVSKCIICESVFHWARDCPDAYENKAMYEGSNEPVNLFVGYVSDRDGDGSHERLQKLVSEAKGCAVIDTGCSNTVCGSKWLEDYVDNLSDYERGLIKEESSNSSFTFGNGVSVISHKRVSFPCHIGEMYAIITTEVVECNLPLLLSRVSMNRARMIINCETNQIMVDGKKSIIDLRSSSSGHYLLPLSL